MHNGSSPRIRVLYFSLWAEGLEEAERYLERLPERDLRSRVTAPGDDRLLELARLDCDWDGENQRCLASMTHPALDFLPLLVTDAAGVLDYLSRERPSDEVPWLVLTAQQPAAIETVVGRLLRAFTAEGGRVLYWAYDEASRNLACFADGVAPYLSVLIHDESPLAANVRNALRPGCRSRHQSWVANIPPFRFRFDPLAGERIVFLGSALGMTSHRRIQIERLERHFESRFLAITDHSVPVGERDRFAAMRVHFCPEGRKFATPAMSQTHTDRPFWAGCLGQVPVVEDSRAGGRLERLARRGLILRYPHGDLDALVAACESALALDVAWRRRIYEHFNVQGTVGPIIAEEIACTHHRTDRHGAVVERGQSDEREARRAVSRLG